jgi:nucleoside-diphosphate-sugar epimerase
MKVLITGNMGYVGPVLVRHLRAWKPEIEVVGYDSGLFAHCLTVRDRFPEVALKQQFFGDVRNLSTELLRSIDAVVHLAAVSNDPMGHRFETPTEEINHRATVEVAARARDAGVSAFVFASSCSIYGYAEDGARKESDPVNPLTAYARSKIAAECALAQMDKGDMVVTSLRFATACGMSERLRLDLVLNDFVASAVATGEIKILSDGSPWRPLIDVSDMARAFEWAILRPASHGGQYLAVNTGADDWNYRVRDLAEAVAEEIPGTTITINEHAAQDKRSYQVDFALYRSLAPDHQPRMTLSETVRQIRHGLSEIEFVDRDFRHSDRIRLRVLDQHIAAGRLSPQLRWTDSDVSRKSREDRMLPA